MKKNSFWIIIGGALFIGMLVAISAESVQYSSRWRNEFGGVVVGAFGKAKLRNTIEISTDEAKNLIVEYHSQEIHVYPSKDDNIVIKEYLASDREDIKAEVTIEDGTARVESKTNVIYIFSFFGGEKIEVYLPQHILNEIELVTTSGNITQKEAFDAGCTSLSVAANSGNIVWKETAAEKIRFKATSGNINLNNISGAGTIKANSGNIHINHFSGSGEVEATSGNIDLEAETISGNLSLRANSGNVTLKAQQVKGNVEAHTTSGNVSLVAEKMEGNLSAGANSGNVRMELPEDMEFRFEAHTTSGAIHTSFDESLSFNKKGNEAKGQVGKSDQCLVSVSATSGSVRVNR